MCEVGYGNDFGIWVYAVLLNALGLEI